MSYNGHELSDDLSLFTLRSVSGYLAFIFLFLFCLDPTQTRRRSPCCRLLFFFPLFKKKKKKKDRFSYKKIYPKKKVGGEGE